jgi:hypothetical protein
MEANRLDIPHVDVVVLYRTHRPPSQCVLEAIKSQTGVRVHLHLQEGDKNSGDANRWVTIARARNRGKRYCNASWVMFVDDDVLLGPNCVANLLSEIERCPNLGAIAANYDSDSEHPARVGHVSMGATLFRREALDAIQFRSTTIYCECWCACMDLRSLGWQIQYSRNAEASHLRSSEVIPEHAFSGASPSTESTPNSRVIFAAFDRRDIARFEKQFLQSLRANGNKELVKAVAYGLYPSEQQRLRRLPSVEFEFLPFNGAMPPVRRLADFAGLAAQLASETLVAYWDVADVIFQDSLSDLWQEVTRSPDRLLAVKEPIGYPHNQVIPAWSLSIRSPSHRAYAFRLLRENVFLNSGFAAGTAAIMRRYFERASQMLAGHELNGTTDWGDQMALNIYCHSQPNLWRAVDQRWNYCVHDRPAGMVSVNPKGRIETRNGDRVSVAHGNARSLRQFALSILDS